MHETYVSVGGKWRYLWRAVDANAPSRDIAEQCPAGKRMIDFRLTARRDARAAKATLSGIETIRTIKRGLVYNKKPGVKGKIEFISRLFGAV